MDPMTLCKAGFLSLLPLARIPRLKGPSIYHQQAVTHWLNGWFIQSLVSNKFLLTTYCAGGPWVLDELTDFPENENMGREAEDIKLILGLDGPGHRAVYLWALTTEVCFLSG